jgi:hypothetical protein
MKTFATLTALALASAATFAQAPVKPGLKGSLIGNEAAAVGEAPVPVIPVVSAADDTPEKNIARFFAYVQRKEVDQAYDQLTRGTKIAERAEDVKLLKSKTKDALAMFGTVLGYEIVTKKNVSERLVSYTCISLGKEFPLRWRFYFYKPAELWKLVDLRVDDRLAAIFDEQEDPRARSEQPAQ